MKKVIIILASVVFSFTSVDAQLKVDNSGMVSVGQFRFDNWTDLYLDKSFCCGAPGFYPERDWYFHLGKEGKRVGAIWVQDIQYNHLYQHSDRNLKTNIESLGDVSSKLKLVNSYTFNYKKELFKDLPKKIRKDGEKLEYGFIAQEFQKVFPELVKKSEKGILSVDYVSMIPILTKAINDHQKQIETLQKIVYSQEKEIVELKSLTNTKNQTLNQNDDNLFNDAPKLFNNIPNPFNSETIIKFYIPKTSTSAMLIITDLQGKEVKSFNIQAKGERNVTINSSELYDGMFIYTLLVDNKIIDTKKMILRKK